MCIENDLEFSLLTAELENETECVSSCWNLTLFPDKDILGQLYSRPIDVTKFITISVKSLKDDTFRARFKSFVEIQEDLELGTLATCKGSDSQKRLLVFLWFHSEYIEKLTKKLNKTLKEAI